MSETMNRHRRRPDMTGATRLALLRMIRDGIFISRSQVLALSREYGISSAAASITETVRVLVRSKLVTQDVGDGIVTRVVYTITKKGLSVLEHEGEGLASVTSDSDVLADPAQTVHFLFINELRIALLPFITNWAGERQVRSLRITNQLSFAKDYDAVVELQLRGVTVRFAIEYELSHKSKERYASIARTLQTERNVDAVLYLTSNPELQSLICAAMNECRNVCIANAKIFLSQLILTEVVTGTGTKGEGGTFESFLSTRAYSRFR